MINLRRYMPIHILIKLKKNLNIWNKYSAAGKSNKKTYEGIPIKLTSDLSTETLHVIREV